MTSGLLSIINYISEISDLNKLAEEDKDTALLEIHKITKTLINIYIQQGKCPDKTPLEIAKWLHKETI